MDDCERLISSTLGRSGGRANHFGNSRDSKSVDETQNIFDAMNARAREYAPIKEASAQNAAQSGVDWTNAMMSRYPREQGWPIAGLSRDRERIAVPQLRRKRETLLQTAARRQGDHSVEIRIALENSRGISEHENIDRRIRPRPP